MSGDRQERPVWRLACRRGLRRAIRRVLGAVRPNRGTEAYQAKKPYWSEAGQRFGVVAAVNEEQEVRQSVTKADGLKDRRDPQGGGRGATGAGVADADHAVNGKRETPAVAGTR
jgi:hypothetical protein